MGVLPEWSDPDRRLAALDRVLTVVLGGHRYRNRAGVGNIPYPLLRSPPPQRTTPTPAELRVLRCMSHGMTREMTAGTLDISLETVKSHLINARHVLAAKNTTHACCILIREGWID